MREIKCYTNKERIKAYYSINTFKCLYLLSIAFKIIFFFKKYCNFRPSFPFSCLFYRLLSCPYPSDPIYPSTPVPALRTSSLASAAGLPVCPELKSSLLFPRHRFEPYHHPEFLVSSALLAYLHQSSYCHLSICPYHLVYLHCQSLPCCSCCHQHFCPHHFCPYPLNQWISHPLCPCPHSMPN